MRTGLAPLGLLLGLLAPAALAQAPPPPPGPPPDLAALRALGARTTKALEQRPATWTLFVEVGEDFVLVEVVSAPPRRTIEVAIEKLGVRTKVLSILERDGRWLVAEADGVEGAYRPWEAPLVHAGLLAPIARALRPETAADVGEPGTFRGAAGGAAAWSIDSPEGSDQLVDEAEAELRRWMAEDPQSNARDPRVRSRLAFLTRARRELAEGTVTRIDQATGLVLVAGPPAGRRALSSFAWLEAAPEERFAAAAAPPRDLTGDPTAGDLADLALLAQAGEWGPEVAEGKAKVTFDARLVNVATGAVRRVPFDLGPCLPGAFSADRRRVYVTAREPAAAVGLWEVDLAARRRRRLGPPAFTQGECSFPALAPDGKTLAVLHRGPGAAARVHLVDLAKPDASRPIGPTVEGACLAWLPSGKGLLLALRHADAQLLGRLELDGRHEALRPGVAPLPLPDGVGLAFLDPATGLWCATRVEPGADVRPWLGGLRGHSAPALSPDGRRLLMIDGVGASGRPGPVLIDVATGASKPLDLGRGAWGYAVWR